MKHRQRSIMSAMLLALTLASPGCVRRTLTVNTDPQGARVWLNNKEIGTTPVSTDFTWYGDYDVTIRKAGYATINTHYKVDAPWYQWPGIDLVSEVLVPVEIHDQRTFPTYVLEARTLPEPESLLERADAMRAEAVFGGE